MLLLQKKLHFNHKFKKKLTPSQTVTLGFVFIIFVGAFLLNLPFASKSGNSVGFINALFTAVSANCVTGLSVVTTRFQWSLFGKAVILILIQLGGLGFMTVVTVFLLVFKMKISLRDRLTIQASFNQNDFSGMVRLVRSVIVTTLALEGIGAVILGTCFYLNEDITIINAVGWGVFHSISAFCNAGFDIIGSDSIIPYVHNFGINFMFIFLIVAGGLGFTVWQELFMLFKKVFGEKRNMYLQITKLSLHSKLAVIFTFCFLVLGTVLFLFLEWDNAGTIGTYTPGQKVGAALFQSVTLRTAGFTSVKQNALTEASQFISCIWMLVGGSPAGTAGGIKTVTVGVIFMSMVSVLKGKNQIEAFGRKISLDILQKALCVSFMILLVVIISALCLYITEREGGFPHSFMDLLFEASSAVGTAGITTGITPYLSVAGKINLILCMFIGRLGPLTVAVSLSNRLQNNRGELTYPEEKIIIG